MTDHPIPFKAPMVRALIEGRKTQTRRVLKPQVYSLCRDQPNPGCWSDERWRCMYIGCWPDGLRSLQSPPYAVGDRLCVREAWRTEPMHDTAAPRQLFPDVPLLFEADDPERKLNTDLWGRLRPPLSMPRWASRLTLYVTEVRVERVQDISEEDAIAEGIVRKDPTPEDLEWYEGYAEENGVDPASAPMPPVWLAPGTRQGWGPRRNEPQWGATPQFAFRCLWDSINAKRGHPWDANPWTVAYTFNVVQQNIDAAEPLLASEG